MKLFGRKLTKRITNIFLALTIALWQLAIPVLMAKPVGATFGHKVTICHANSAVGNAYNKNNVDYDAVNGQGGGSDHMNHTGPVFNSSMQQGDDWGDIIPPVPGVTPGLNWTVEGQAIWNNDCSTKGSIKVIKDAQPNSNDDFDFTVKKGNSTVDTFELDDYGFSIFTPNNKTVNNLSAGDYVVTEDPDESGWAVTDVVCSNGTVFTKDLANKKVTITLGVAQNITCTFVNERLDAVAPKLTLTKVIDGSQYGDTTTVNDFGLTVGGNPVTSSAENNYSVGSYAISEAGHDGYEFVNITGDAKCPAVLGGSVNLEFGDDINCVIHNKAKQPKLEVAKRVINDDGGTKQSGEFELFVNGQRINDPRRGGGDDTDNTTFHYYENAAVGVEYAISETTVDGYEASDVVCVYYGTDVVVPHPVTLALGEHVVCTITNDDVRKPEGSLTIVKDADPNHEQDFSFELECDEVEEEVNVLRMLDLVENDNCYTEFDLDDDSDPTLDNSKTFGLDPGWYVVTELPTADWDLADIDCGEAEEYVYGNTVVVYVGDGDEVVCEFTNEQEVYEEPQLGSIQGVVFEDANQNGTRDEGEQPLSDWTVNLYNYCGEESECEEELLNTTQSNEEGSYDFSELPFGAYKVCEIVKDGWAQTSPVEDDGCHVVFVGFFLMALQLDNVSPVVASYDFGNYFKGSVQGDNNTPETPQVQRTLSTNTLANTGEGYDLRGSIIAVTLAGSALVTTVVRRKKSDN